MDLPPTLLAGLIFLPAWYSLNGVFALAYARQPLREERPLIGQVFGGLSELMATWGTVVAILVVPVLISWLSGVADQMFTIQAGLAVHIGCVSLLSVMVTLAVSLLYDLRLQHHNPFRSVLFSALFADIFSLLFVGAGFRHYAQLSNPARWDTLIASMLIMIFFSLGSSFSIYLLARKADQAK